MCPSHPPRPAVSTIQVEPTISNLTLLEVQLLTPLYIFSVCALFDSGSSGNFISPALPKRLGLPLQRHEELKVETIQGKPLGRGRVKFKSPPLILQIGCLHSEQISFLVLEGPTVDIILGRPWLTQHSPEVRWDTSEILKCFLNCLSNVPEAPVSEPKLHVGSTLVESPEPQTTPRSHLTTRRSRMSSVNRQPPSYHLIGHGTVPSTCCLEPPLPRGGFTPCPSRSARRWRITSMRLSNNSLFDHPPHQRPRASSSWVRRTGACGPASIIEHSMNKLLNSLIHFPWSRPLSRNSVGLASS